MPNAVFNIDGHRIEVVPHPMFDEYRNNVILPYQVIDGMLPRWIQVTKEFYDQTYNMDRKDNELTNLDCNFNMLHSREQEDFFENVYSILIQRKTVPAPGEVPILIDELRISTSGYWAAMTGSGIMILDPSNVVTLKQ
jgi:hypothetical protein